MARTANMACGRTVEIQLYHDGELGGADHEEVTAHLQECAECRRLLADLQRLSSLLSEAPLVQMRPDAMDRLGRYPHTAAERGILRIAGWLTATAAAVLIGTLLTRPNIPVEMASRPAIWETMAVMPPAEERDETNSDLAVAAQWMADDLSADGNGER